MGTMYGGLNPDSILDAAEDVFRRFGPQKTTIVDVARELGVSHGTVYRHYPSKAALRDAVTRRWLRRISLSLEKIAERPGPATRRLRRWLDELVVINRRRHLDEPELAAMYQAVAADARAVVHEHVEELLGQLARIIREGAEQGEFRIGDAQVAARAIFDATARFHHPAHAPTMTSAEADAGLDDVWRLILKGLVKRPG